MHRKAEQPGNKWLHRAEAAWPVTRVVHQAVVQRMQSVLHFLPLAAEQYRENPEYVHQLRVSARRGGAALRLFKTTLPRRRSRRVVKVLRAVRRASNEARDIDVFALRIQNHEALAGSVCERALSILTEARIMAQQPVLKSCDMCNELPFDRSTKKLLNRIRWRDDSSEPTYHDFAISAIKPFVKRFVRASQWKLTRLTEMHEFRILSKKLRYTMELTAPAFESKWRRELYPVVENIQRLLGEINDHATAQQRCQHWFGEEPQLASEIQSAIFPSRVLSSSVAEFHQFWSAERRRKFTKQLKQTIS